MVRIAKVFFLLIMVSLCSCKKDTRLKAFESDGCSLFPDKSLITEEDWCECCFEHDIAYWRGGTKEEREIADMLMRECILEKTGDAVLADVMYHGVRFGGSPYFYNWYRWGYGWSYERKYQALTDDQVVLAEEMLEAYFKENPNGFCLTEPED